MRTIFLFALIYQVLLTDTDVVYLQNPFGALYRDADIESMSDGWDAHTLHGAQPPTRVVCTHTSTLTLC